MKLKDAEHDKCKLPSITKWCFGRVSFFFRREVYPTLVRSNPGGEFDLFSCFVPLERKSHLHEPTPCRGGEGRGEVEGEHWRHV